ncbi:GNAT family N-acetyltransferase [Halorussus sp. MSC15.2]|uniref:GNAT family N-acetyltransferase n=1 Tax=Halorussus sp. MSC15.2 TaxID=2283638 RepID=UPI0013D5A854|nr:GNAT family protein [Halorussus sp. MSC15.2]NEU57214.1 GNAT family N-acetyltransferase [Halorussus sp. MSC15.2]
MPGPVFISGERVDLRVTEREDLDLLQRARSDPDIRTALTFTEPQTRGQVEAFYENTVAADNGDANFLVCTENREGALGEVDLFGVEDDHAEIAYWLVPEARGEGYATEAVTLLLDYAFETRGLRRTYARVVEHNDGSHDLLERLGFTEEGRLREHVFLDGEYRDVVLYGLLRDEWDGAP